MHTHGLYSLAALAFTGAALPIVALAQAYPTKAIRLIVPFPPGGSTDLMGRVLGAKFGETFGQQVIVENRPGASGMIGNELVARAAPDGYILTMGTIGAMSVNVSLFKSIPYDSTRDFAPITLTGSVENLLVVHPSVPAHNVRELIALAASKPGMLIFASSGTGNAPHLAGELFNQLAKVKMVHLPYKGGGPAMIDLVAGQVSLSFASMPSSLPFAKSGKLRAIAVTSAKRSPAVPQVQTIAESGVPGFETVQWIAMSAPRGTPKPAIERLNAEIAAGMKSPDLRERLAGQGYQPEPSTPQQLSETVKIEFARFAKLIKAINLKDE